MIQPEPLLRPRLMRWLTRALRSGHVCIEAPGGYGKSTLLRSLLTQRAHCYYFDLTYSDADLQVLQARLADLPKQADVTILLDDLHHIADAEPTLHWLFQQMMPLQARFVLSGRHVPLPSVNTPIGWLRTRDLAFSAQETNVWFRDPKWQTITNGWPLALMLARQSASDSTMIDPTFAKQQLFDSLAYRYLAGLPTVLIHFMQTTAVPLRFNFALAEELWHDAKVDRGNTQDTFAIDSGSGLRSAHSLFTELQQRNLFLEPVTTQPGWFKYHDLIREFLVDQLPMDPSRVYMRVIDWFNRQGDFEMAIEHALTSQLYSRAIELIKQIPGNFVREQARIHTYHRWFASLPLGLRQRHPILMVRLGQYLLEAPEFSQEAWGLVNQAAEIAEQMGDVTTLIQARTQLGRFHYYAGDYPEAQRILEQVIAEPRTTAADLSYVLRLLGVTLAESGYYRQARQVHLRAIKLAHSRGDGNEENTLRQNLAGTVLNPLGEFNIAEEHLRAAFDFYRHAPGTQIRCLTMLCDVQMLKGDWQTLTQTLDQIDLLRDQLETVERGEQVFSLFYRSAIETAGGNLNAARKLYEEFRTLSLEERAMLQISRAWLEVWLCRREGRIEDAIRAADDLLSSTIQMPYYRAQIALMRDIALYMRLSPAEPALDLHPESANLIGWRARADLVHLRALLALDCWRRNDPRWQRHARSALRATTRPGYELLLTTRDPDLGARFWMLCIAEGFATDRAVAALRQLGTIEPLVNLLLAPVQLHSDWKMRAIRGLARIGHEAAIPLLLDLQKQATGQAMATEIESALSILERQPPPFLDVQLMGDFAVWRAGTLVGEEVWPRPIVKKLLQYFCLHHKEALPRDRILDDLWPDDDHQAAAVTFRTVHSRLRNVLEPHLRPKAHSRYFSVEGDVYNFDPQDRVRIDTEHVTQTIRSVILQAEQHDMPPLPAEFMAALESWQPLLPALPYEEWLIATREQINALYIEGCLYAANANLIHDELQTAIDWAQRALIQAPWLEEAYQILMRCRARLDERSLALKIYATAVVALEREFSAPPSPLTEWLADRLRKGEEI